MILAGAFTGAFSFIAHHPGFLAEKAAEQLELAGAALAIALAASLPVGVMLGHLHRGASVAIGASIVGRALPSLVLIGVFLTVLGIGFVNNMVALAVLATGGVYIAGGVAPRFAGVLDREFAAAFRAKGGHAALMARIPVRLIGDPRLGLLGALRCARSSG